VDRLPERIEGDGLLLRRWTVEDAELLHRALAESAEHLRPWMPWLTAEPQTLTAQGAMLARREREWEAGGDVLLGVFVAGEVAGGCGLHHRHGPGTLAIGYWTHVGFLQRSLATGVAALLTETALALPGVAATEIHHDKANALSARIPRRLGYRFLGETPDTPEAPAEVGIDWAWRLERGETARPAAG
jgi:ribosomal-protein-serine acetyltransferase